MFRVYTNTGIAPVDIICCGKLGGCGPLMMQEMCSARFADVDVFCRQLRQLQASVHTP